MASSACSFVIGCALEETRRWLFIAATYQVEGITKKTVKAFEWIAQLPFECLGAVLENYYSHNSIFFCKSTRSLGVHHTDNFIIEMDDGESNIII